MSEFSLRTQDGRTAFEPGERITVVAKWQCDFEPPNMEIQIGWSTAGKGTTDQGVEKSVPISDPRRSESREIVLDLPAAPYSFSGKLISLIWALELVAEPAGRSRLPITIAPGAQEVLLQSPEKNALPGV